MGRLVPSNQLDPLDPLTPIHEFDEDNSEKVDRVKAKAEHMKSYHDMLKRKDRQKEVS